MFLLLSDKNYVVIENIMSIHTTSSNKIKKLINAAKLENRLIDTTGAKPTRSAILMNNSMIYLSSVLPETLVKRIAGNDTTETENTVSQDKEGNKNKGQEQKQFKRQKYQNNKH